MKLELANSPIKNNEKVIIGLGDSFTQGVGGWSEKVYKRFNNKIDYNKLNRNEQLETYKNSWVNVLCEKYFPDHHPINLGVLGIGNRAASSELHLNPRLNLDKASGGYVIFMLSGMERFDFVNDNFESSHFFAIWPTEPHEGTKQPKLWKSYLDEAWGERFAVTETIISIRNVETFCKANKLELILTSAFDQRYTRKYFLETLGNKYESLIDSVPWDRFVYPENYPSFINLLVELEGHPQSMALGEFWPHYNNLPAPSTYISNCAHPTIKGYEVIADKIYEFIRKSY
jgi:WD40 repeat protein